jgi:hypothetical protein
MMSFFVRTFVRFLLTWVRYDLFRSGSASCDLGQICTVCFAVASI